ncbi:CRISPR system precrRNA processing endoribonuclease RAMP protein Cas6 [Spirulina sp. CCNP1310]|nr:CRISPR system precrRNA processing endoribonuclease RAMP protein Cas6 [Spirulina sp. CCNP1310]
MMLIRASWQLTPVEPISLPRAYGLELVKMVHEKMGLRLGDEAVPSTSFAGLLGQAQYGGDFVRFDAGERYQMMLGGLCAESSQRILNLDLGEKLAFLGATFAVADPVQVVTSYEQLYTEQVAQEPEALREFSLQFLTPTAFSQQRLHLPLPVPTLMLRSWLERWNHFAPVFLGGDELVQYFGEAIALKRHQIRTRTHSLHRGYLNGFVGDVTIQVLTRTDPLLANVAHLLVNYSQFAGTGMKTRLGMGKVVVLNADG